MRYFVISYLSVGNHPMTYGNLALTNQKYPSRKHLSEIIQELIPGSNGGIVLNIMELNLEDYMDYIDETTTNTHETVANIKVG